MNNIIDRLKEMPDYIGSNGRTEDEIQQAEKALGVSFSEDYRNYLKEIGLACFDGHELTGLTQTKRLDVVSITKEKREQFGNITSLWYVIEETNIFGIVIWQSSDGSIYETAPNSKAKKIDSSLAEYITKH